MATALARVPWADLTWIERSPTIAPMSPRKEKPTAQKRGTVSPPDPPTEGATGRTTVGLPRSMVADIRDAIALDPSLAEDPANFVRAAVEAALRPHQAKIAKFRAWRASQK